MTDSLYARQGRLLDYHWEYVNMHYDFGLFYLICLWVRVIEL